MHMTPRAPPPPPPKPPQRPHSLDTTAGPWTDPVGVSPVGPVGPADPRVQWREAPDCPHRPLGQSQGVCTWVLSLLLSPLSAGGGGGGGWHEAMVLVCLPLAAPIGLSPLHILTLCGSERVLVVSTEPPDDLSCWTTPGVCRPGDGAVARAGDQGHPGAHSESIGGFADSSTDLCAPVCASAALGGGGGCSTPRALTRTPPPPRTPKLTGHA